MTVASESVLFNSIYPKLEKHIHPLKLLEELEKAYAEHGGAVDNPWNWEAICLLYAFTWRDTPQGGAFWAELDNKSNDH